VLKHTLAVTALLLSSFAVQAQQTNETLKVCQFWKDSMEQVLILQQWHTREELEPMLSEIGIDLVIVRALLEVAYHLPVLDDPVQQEILSSGILSMVYIRCLENDGFVGGVPQ